MADWVRPLIALSIFVAGGIAFQFLWGWLVLPRVEQALPPLGAFLRGLRGLVAWSLVLAGAYYAVAAWPGLEEYPWAHEAAHKTLVLATVLMVTVAAIRVVQSLLRAQEQRAQSLGEDLRDLQTRNSLVERLAVSILAGFGALYGLRAIGADITPLLFGGTVGGIILGLALQDSLSHFFAGIFFNFDRPARIGDLIRFEDGKEGFVETVGWRYTKVRLWSNALLVLPNNKFAQSTIMNLHSPAPDTSVGIELLVSVDNDLEHVETLAIETAKQAMVELGAADQNPSVRFQRLDERGVHFKVFVRALDPESQYLLSHETLKRIHTRFRSEGIRLVEPLAPFSRGPN